MGYTKEQLLSELHKCYEEHDKVTVKILNDSNNEYPTQPTYTKHFGSVTEAKKQAGLQLNITKDEISDIAQSILDSDNNISLTSLEENGIPPRKVYAHFDSIDDVVRYVTEEEPENFYRSNYLSIMKGLDEISQQSIDNCDDLPSYSTICNYFDGINEIKNELGYDIQDSYKQQAKELIEEYDDSIDYTKDGYIYCYEFTLYDEKCYYVGETTNILQRISAHLKRKNIRTKMRASNGNILSKRGAQSDNITINKIVAIIQLDKENNETEENFTRRRLYEENKLKNTIVLEKNTLNVFGQ